MPNSKLKLLAFGLYLLLFVVVGLEIALRIFPGVIPLHVLKDFDDDLRREIAERRDLYSYEALRGIPRDDGGPPLYVFLPRSKVPKGLFKDIGYTKTIALDERGYCNPEPIAKPPVEAITLSGSHGWCFGVDPSETWTARLAQISGVKTYNFATPGTGPYEYLQLLKETGLSLNPRIVFFNILEENDMRDVVRYWNYRRDRVADDGLSGDQQFVLRSRTSGGVLARNSYLFGFIRAIIISRQLAHARNSALGPFPGLPEQKKVNYRFAVKFGEQVVPFNQDNSNKGQPLYAMALVRGLINLEEYRPALEELARSGREHGFTPVVVYTPSAGAVYSDNIHYEDTSLAPIMLESSNRQRKYLARATKDLGLMFVDLTPPLQAAAKVLKGDEVLFFVDTVHLNGAGHRITAEFLSRSLADLLANAKVTTR